RLLRQVLREMRIAGQEISEASGLPRVQGIERGDAVLRVVPDDRSHIHDVAVHVFPDPWGPRRVPPSPAARRMSDAPKLAKLRRVKPGPALAANGETGRRTGRMRQGGMAW